MLARSRAPRPNRGTAGGQSGAKSERSVGCQEAIDHEQVIRIAHYALLIFWRPFFCGNCSRDYNADQRELALQSKAQNLISMARVLALR